MTELPAWGRMITAAYTELDTTRSGLSEARDWLRSDWRDGTAPTDRAALHARVEALDLIGQAKNLIDQAKNQLDTATDRR